MNLLLLIFMLLLSGCNLFSDNPLSDPALEPIDPSLIGTWAWNDDGDWGFVHIGTDAGRKGLCITMVEFKDDGRMETTEFRGHSARLSSRRYLNLKWTRQPEKDRGYFFVEYRIAGGTLEGSFLDTATFEAAIRDGSLKGEILSPGGILPTVLIRADQAELRQFVLQNEKRLLKDTFKLRKVVLSDNRHRSDAAGGAVPVSPGA